MDSSNQEPFVIVSNERVQNHLRRVVAKRIDRLMQQSREVRASRVSHHANRPCNCETCDCPNEEAA